MPKINELRVWAVRNMLGEPTFISVENPKQASQIIAKMAKEDLKDPSIFSNAFGLEVYEEIDGKGVWSEWYDENGDDIKEAVDEELYNK